MLSLFLFAELLDGRSNMRVICFVCLDTLVGKEAWSLNCGHIFCRPCIEGIQKTSNICPCNGFSDPLLLKL